MHFFGFIYTFMLLAISEEFSAIVFLSTFFFGVLEFEVRSYACQAGALQLQPCTQPILL
jgi:hypothetical protein